MQIPIQLPGPPFETTRDRYVYYTELSDLEARRRGRDTLPADPGAAEALADSRTVKRPQLGA